MKKKFDFHDFSVMISDPNGHWVRIEELNDLIKNSVIIVDEEKLKEHQNKIRNYKK